MLPPLPKKNNHKEADDGLDFRTWFASHRAEFDNASFELKDSRGKDYIPFNEITDEQVDSALRTMSDKGNLVRVVKGTVGTGDYLYHRHADAYLVATYRRNTYLIPMERFIYERDCSERKSLTEIRASQIGTQIHVWP